MKKTLICLCYIILAATSCSKADSTIKNDDKTSEEPTNQNVFVDYKLSDQTILFNDEMIKSIEIIDSATIVFAAGYPKEKMPSEGDIIIIPSSVSCPDGLLGRITFGTKASGTIGKVQPVSLDNAFTELTVQGDVDMNNYIKGLEDEDGNFYDAKSASEDVWEQFDTVKTKAGALEVAKPIEVEISNSFFRGKFYMNSTLNVDIRIRNGKMEACKVMTINKGGFVGEFNFLFNKGKKTFPFVAASLPVPLGPVALKPTLRLDAGVSLEGKNSLKMGVEYIMFNERVGVAFDGIKWSSERKKLDGTGGTKTLLSWEMDGSVKLSTDVSLRYCIFNENVLAAGVGIRPFLKLSGEVSFSPSMKNLLEVNPEVKFEQGVEVFVYAYARLLQNTNLDKYECSYAPVASSQTLNLLTAFNNMKIHRSGGNITVSCKPEFRSAMRQDEQGVALFKKGEDVPVERHKFESPTKSEEQYQVTFNNVNGPYEIKSYVIAQEGNYYYASIDETSSICPDAYHIHAIDLGLSVKWACCNVGATKPNEFGGYYAWGETMEKSIYSETTYTHAHGIDTDGDMWFEKDIVYDDIGQDICGTQYDVAHVKWGGSWRMPTEAEVQELIDNCDRSDYYYMNGVLGLLFTSRIAGFTDRSLFFPAAGFHYLDVFYSDSGVRCWTGTFGDAPNHCYAKAFFAGDVSNEFWAYGLTVRPVTK